jgi:hypothetical protein
MSPLSLSHPGNYNDDPPATFKCGHARSRENIGFKGGNPKCKQCSEAYQKAYRMRNTEHPHLYPSKQAA